MAWISVQLKKIPEGSCWTFHCHLSMQFSPLLHSSLRTLAILTSQDFHLCPLHPRKELRSSYTHTAAWKCSAGSELQQWQVSSFVSNFSRRVIFYWFLCNVLKNHYPICLLCFCGSLRWEVKFGRCYPIVAKVEAAPWIENPVMDESAKMNSWRPTELHLSKC